jgi:general secretion pathway protein K
MRSSALQRRPDKGFVLVTVLLVVALLAVLLVEFNYQARVGLDVADNASRSLRAFYCAEAGVQAAMAALRVASDPYESDELREVLSGSVRIAVGEGFCQVRLSEENGRLNLNTLRDAQGRPDRRRVDQFLRLIDVLNRAYGDEAPIGYGIAPALIDWTDPDDDVTRLSFIQRENEGAESAYYEGLDRPYSCKNRPLDTADELLLVKGMTRDIYEGRRADPVRGVSAAPGMKDCVTVFGDGLISVNDAPAPVLFSLSEQMQSATIEDIMKRRKERPFRDVSELRSLRGMTDQVFNEVRRLVTVRPRQRFFRVTARGVAGDCVREVRVVLRCEAGKVEPVAREET